MVSIAILEDEELYLKKEKKITEEYFKNKQQECRVEIFQDADWFMHGVNEEKFDIYVLDVEMPKNTGLDVARKIRSLYPDPVIIFVTNYVDYAVAAYEVNTYRYIPKEVLAEKLTAAYDTLLPQIVKKEKRYLVVEKKSNIERIEYDDIYYMKKDGRYTVVIHKNGETRVRDSLANMLQRLGTPEFIYIDKGCIVNILHIMVLKEHVIRMRDGMKLPVGLPREGQVRKAILDFWKK